MLESHSFLSQAREPWITFSKVFAIQYDACHGRLNPCGGRLHSLRPVVSRLCFFSLHLISHPKFQSSTHFFFLPWSVYFLFIWFSNPNFQSFTHFLFELNFNFFLPWSAASDEHSFALSEQLKKTVLTCLNVESNLRSLFRYWKSQSALNVGLVVLSALGNDSKKKVC